MSCFPANSCPPIKKFARKKGHSTKERITLVSFFYVMPLKITTPPRLFRSGLRRGNFQPALISMVSLHGFSIPILPTQSNLKSALLFSCTCPFSGAYAHYIPSRRKSQTYVCVFLRKCKKIFSELSTIQRRKTKINAALQRKPARRDDKRRSASGSARTPFRGGSFCRCVFFLVPPIWVR